jgi:hypothetical protein
MIIKINIVLYTYVYVYTYVYIAFAFQNFRILIVNLRSASMKNNHRWKCDENFPTRRTRFQRFFISRLIWNWRMWSFWSHPPLSVRATREQHCSYLVRKYFRTKVAAEARKYFRTKVLSYKGTVSIFVLSYFRTNEYYFREYVYSCTRTVWLWLGLCT